MSNFFQSSFGFLFGGLSAGVIDFGKLTLSEKILAALGYLTLLTLLLGSLLPAELLQRSGMITYNFTEDKVNQAPLAVTLLSAAGFVLGWAFVLTGATDCTKRVFYPVLLAFCSQMIIMVAGNNDASTGLVCVGFILLMGLVAGVSLLYGFTRRQSAWRDWPLVEFIFWGMVLVFFNGIALLGGKISGAAAILEADFLFILLPTLLFWAFSGLGAVDAAINIARWANSLLRVILPADRLPGLQFSIIIFHPFALVIGIGAGYNLQINWTTNLLLEMIPAGIILLIAGLLLIIGRFRGRVAAVLLTASLASPVFMLSWMNIDLENLTGSLLEQSNLLPQNFLFVGLMIYSLMKTSAEFSNHDGRILPRSGRMMLSFGYALLVTSLSLFMINRVEMATGATEPLQEITNLIFSLTLISLGPIYLIWMMIKRPDFLAGKIPTSQPLLTGLIARWPPLVWRGCLLAVLCVLMSVCCIMLTVLINVNPTPFK